METAAQNVNNIVNKALDQALLDNAWSNANGVAQIVRAAIADNHYATTETAARIEAAITRGLDEKAHTNANGLATLIRETLER